MLSRTEIEHILDACTKEGTIVTLYIDDNTMVQGKLDRVKIGDQRPYRVKELRRKPPKWNLFLVEAVASVDEESCTVRLRTYVPRGRAARSVVEVKPDEL